MSSGPPEAHPEGTLARIWIDCSTPARIRLTISDGPRTQYYRRDFELEHGLDSVALELLALVVQSSLESLAAGRPIGNEGSEPGATSLPDAAPVPETAAEANTAAEPGSAAEPDDGAARTPATSTWSEGVPLTWYARYEALMLGSEEALHGPGLGARVGISQGATPVLVGVTGLAYWPTTVSDDGFGARLRVYEARARLSAGIANAGSLSTALVTGLGFWFIHVQPAAFGNGVPGEVSQLAAPFWTRSVIAYAGASAEWRLAGLNVAIDLGAELELSRLSFSVERDGRSQTLFTPWWVRPRLGVAVGF